MSNYVDLLNSLKNFCSDSAYSPYFGTVINLDSLKIRLNEKVILNEKHIKSIINLKDRNQHGEYIHLGKEVVLLPYNTSDSKQLKFIVLGVVQNG